MGNQQSCCGNNTSSEAQKQYDLSSKVYTFPENNVSSSNYLSLLNPEVRQVYDREKPFEQEFNQQQNKHKKIDNDIYYGPLDQNDKPTKLGKLYKSNGALLITIFIGGVAQGPCFYIMNNGSFYRGWMKDNAASCKHGQFFSKSLNYTGGFEKNLFHGEGQETSKDNNYSFKGKYEYGRKVQGTMKWRENAHDHEYTGSFNVKGQFHGKGKYTDIQGTYEGQFYNGKKQGYGIYYYKSKLRYEGHYVDNKRQGEGQIINSDGTIAYKGNFDNGMPHGKGIATSKSGQIFQAEWDKGIDVKLLSK